MSASEDQLSESRHLAIQEFLAALKSESKQARRKALEKFHCETFGEPVDASVPLAPVYAAVSSLVLRALADESEACRAGAIRILESFVKRCDMSDYQLTYIMPALVRRVGRPEIVEDSEELRLLLVALVHTIIERNKSQTLEPFFSDFTSILCKTMLDPFPDVRVQTSTCIQLLASTLQRAFHTQAESYVKPVLPSLAHQRFKVRVAAVNCIGVIVMYGPAKCLEQCVTPLAEKLLDDVAAVREQATLEAGRWMLAHNDRYSYWHRMLPIMLTSLSDSSDDIRFEATELWHKIGLQYMEENEQDLKKMTDFMDNEPIQNYPDVSRPNLGCRTLVARNIGKILPAIARECEGWQAHTRVRVMQLLRWLLLCAEHGVTQHAPAVAAILQHAARDTEPRVLTEMAIVAEYFGIFVAPETWWPLLRPQVESWATLFVLAYITVGTKNKFLHNDGAVLKEILLEISSPDQCQTRKTQQHEALLDLASNVMAVLQESAAGVRDELFTVIFTVRALSEEEDVKDRAACELESLSETVCGYQDVSELYAEQTRRTLASLHTDPAAWSLASPHYCILYAVITEFGSALAEHVPELTAVLRRVLTEPNLDPKVKVKLLNALSMMLIEKHAHFQRTARDAALAFYKCIREEVIMPHLVWQPGLVAESVRCAAASCLCCLLQTEPDDDRLLSTAHHNDDSHNQEVDIFESLEEVSRVTEQMVGIVPGLLDDRSNLTRRRVLVATISLVKIAHRSKCFTVEHLHKIYSAVVRRLDDSCEEVRSLAASALVTLFGSRPADYDTVLYHAHIDTVYSAMLLHLDDSDAKLRTHILKSLEELSVLNPELLLQKVKVNLPLYRNKEAFEVLQKTLSNVSINP